MAERGVAPVVGVVAMVLLTVVLAALVGAMFFGFGLSDPPEAAVTADAAYDATNGTTQVDLMHTSGDTLDVEELVVRVAVNGEPLEDQPTVPAVGMDGYRGPPSGPFNGGKSVDHRWSAGEVAGFVIAKTTNKPHPEPGDRITVRLFVDGHPIVVTEATVR